MREKSKRNAKRGKSGVELKQKEGRRGRTETGQRRRELKRRARERQWWKKE